MNGLQIPLELLGRIEGYLTDVTSVGAGTTWALLQPPEGVAYVVLSASAYHAAGGARTCNWAWLDPVGSQNLYADTAINAATDWPLVTTAGLVVITHGPIIATRTRYPRFALVAVGAGEHVYIKALVAKFIHPTGQM